MEGLIHYDNALSNLNKSIVYPNNLINYVILSCDQFSENLNYFGFAFHQDFIS